MMRNSRDLELLVARIQRQLAPEAEVLHDVRLLGKSRIERQVDVLVRQKIGQYEMKIVLECKDYNRPVDIKSVEEFSGLLADVGGHRGTLVSSKGFTKGAKNRAAQLAIDLYSPIDTSSERFRASVSVPIVCDFRSARLSFQISSSEPYPMRFDQHFYATMKAFDASGQSLGLPMESAITKWNGGNLPIEPGEHHGIPAFAAGEVFVDNGYGKRIPVDLHVSAWVERHQYFGQLAVQKMLGFRDHLSGGVITNAFTIGLLDPAEIERSWRPIEDLNTLPHPPVAVLQGLLAWPEQPA